MMVLLAMKLTIVYDDHSERPELRADRGFSCLIESGDAPAVLFDTGARGSILRHNLAALGIDLSTIGTVVISHRHPDHTGGLGTVIEDGGDVEVFVPPSLVTPESFMMGIAAARVTRVTGPIEIRAGIFTTGELFGVEQSLVIATGKGRVVVVGCAHPGLDRILDAASGFGEVWGLIGGLHGFHDFRRLDPFSLVCPCHCTVYREEIRRLLRGRCVNGGVGTVIEL